MDKGTPIYADQEIDPVTRTESPPEEYITPRVGFATSLYRLWMSRKPYDPCQSCGERHAFFTHGCAPIAWPVGIEVPGWCEAVDDATIMRAVHALPLPIAMGCPLQHALSRAGSHEHLEFEWL